MSTRNSASTRSTVKVLGTGAAATMAGGLAAVSWATQFELRNFHLERYELPVLPAGLGPLKVLHLSDFHLAPWQDDKVAFVQSLAKLEPDFIVLTGDNYGHKDALPRLTEMLAPFRGVPGVSVFGSNDYYGPVLKNPAVYLLPRKPSKPRERDLDEVGLRRLLFDDLGFTDLTNRAALVAAGDVRIRAFGVDDPHIKKDELGLTRSRLSLVSEGSAGWDLTLGLVHAPYQRILNSYVGELGADVVLAGHTHGGQVCLPGKRAIVSNCDLPTSQAGGLSTWTAGGRTAPLHVSRGLGTSIYAPIRTFCPPEATLLTLVAHP